MRLYHGVDGWHELARIREVGFANQADTFLVPPRSGVHLVDRPDFLTNSVAVTVEIVAADFELALFEVLEVGKPYREWLVPATWLNRRAVVSVPISPADARHVGGVEGQVRPGL